MENKGFPDRASRWRCDAAVKFQCSAEGCKEARARVWVNIDFPDRRYERCDSKGCDQYEMAYSVAGIYTTVSPVIGTFLKVLNDGSEFVEVASLGTAVVTSFGRCMPHR